MWQNVLFLFKLFIGNNKIMASELSAEYPLTLKLPLLSCRCNMPVNLITIRALGARYWLLEHILKAPSRCHNVMG